MTTERQYQKTIANPLKFDEEVRVIPSIAEEFVQWGAFGTTLTIELDSDFTTQQETDLDAFMSSWVDFTTAETLKVYLDGTIFPFVDDLINTFAAENIAMGITPAGKTGEVLGLFVKQYDIESNGFPISLKDTFDTGSLHEAIAVLQYVRDNPTEYTGLSPFITDARLLEMINKIEVQLGITPLST